MSVSERGGPRVRPGLVVALVAVLALVCCSGGTASFFLGGLGESDDNDLFSFGCGKSGLTVDPNGPLPRAGSLGDEQMRNAAVIIIIGKEMQIPPRGWVIAIATALQESWLKNLPHLGEKNDHDSVGLFQQRPSQGWGTPEQLQDPKYASRKFYEALRQQDGWLTMPLTDAAQDVQGSAYPDAYAKHEPLATLVVNLLTDGAGRSVGALTDLRCVAPGEVTASGWTVPLRGKIWSGFRTPERPTHYGVDIAADKSTPIHAAAAGIVIRMRCNAVAPDGSNWGCHRDGSPSVRGCGWYVDILHAGSITTRYCHMITQPLVTVGQQVTAGQRIGLSGSTGNSSGPHLHYEVHVNGDTSNRGAIDPVRYMQDMGAPLGEQP